MQPTKFQYDTLKIDQVINSLKRDSNFQKFTSCYSPNADLVDLYYWPPMHTISIKLLTGYCAEERIKLKSGKHNQSIDMSCVHFGSGIGYKLNINNELAYIHEIPGDFGFQQKEILEKCGTISGITTKTDTDIKWTY